MRALSSGHHKGINCVRDRRFFERTPLRLLSRFFRRLASLENRTASSFLESLTPAILADVWIDRKRSPAGA
jgi:hypothetical protein